MKIVKELFLYIMNNKKKNSLEKNCISVCVINMEEIKHETI